MRVYGRSGGTDRWQKRWQCLWRPRLQRQPHGEHQWGRSEKPVGARDRTELTSSIGLQK